MKALFVLLVFCLIGCGGDSYRRVVIVTKYSDTTLVKRDLWYVTQWTEKMKAKDRRDDWSVDTIRVNNNYPHAWDEK